MVSSHYQTTAHIMEDLRFLQQLQPDMISISLKMLIRIKHTKHIKIKHFHKSIDILVLFAYTITY